MQPRSAERDAVQAILLARLSACLRLGGELREAFALGLRADSAAERAGDPTAQGIAWMALGHVLYSVGQLREARRWLVKAAELPGLSPELAAQARMNAAASLRGEGRLAEAEVAFDALQGFAERLPPHRSAALLINSASCWHQVGRAADALEALGHASAILGPGERPDLRAWIDAIGAWAHGARGDDQAAVDAGLAALRVEAGTAIRSSAARALAVVALRKPELAPRVRPVLAEVLDQVERAGARREAVDLHLALLELCEAEDDLVAAVQHLRRARALEAELATDAERLRGEQEDLRIELARMQVEADGLRVHREELARANRALAAADAARSRLLRTLAHDLRNPLQSILAGLDLMDPEDADEVREQRRQMLVAAERMSELLEAALRPPSDAEQPLIDVARLARDSASALGGLARRKGQEVSVEGEEDVSLRVDPEALGRILDNLVSNAIKFAAEGAHTRIVVSSTATRVDLAVIDDGPGFPDLDPEDGLLLGRQLATRATAGESSWGLGLHTVFQLVAEQGGVLALGNRQEGGAVVRVSLPRGS